MKRILIQFIVFLFIILFASCYFNGANISEKREEIISLEQSQKEGSLSLASDSMTWTKMYKSMEGKWYSDEDTLNYFYFTEYKCEEYINGKFQMYNIKLDTVFNTGVSTLFASKDEPFLIFTDSLSNELGYYLLSIDMNSINLLTAWSGQPIRLIR